MLDITPQQRELVDVVRRVVEKEVAPIAQKIEDSATFPKHLIEVFGDIGLMQMRLPEEFGGLGLDLATSCLLKLEVSRVSLTCSHLVGNNSIGMIMPLVHFGTDAQRARWLPMLAQGRTITCVAMSEPQAGSDVAAMRTFARSEGGRYVINGEKACITMAGIADYILLFAKTANVERGVKNISCFIVDARSEGITLGPAEKTTGIRAVPHNSIHFDNVVVPAENRIGEEGRGFLAAMRILDTNRPMVGASAIGLAEGALAEAVDYTKNRRVFGATVSDLQGVQFMLADMATQLEAASCLLFSVARAIDAGNLEDLARRVCMAKLFSTEMCLSVVETAAQLCGMQSFIGGSKIERMLRDSKSFKLVEGTPQIMRVVISRSILEA